MVYLCEHTEKGALGLVINKPIDIKLKNLFEKVELTLDRDDLAEAAGVLRRPGADRARLRAARAPARRRGRHYNSSLQIPGGLEMTTSKDVLEALSNGAGPKKVLVTLGYSGWGAGQLEDEIGRNGWLNVERRARASSSTRRSSSATTRRCRCSASTRACSAQEAGHA